MTPKTRCASANPIALVRSFGVARMPLIGGRYDGGEWTAIVGCPVCIPVKPPKPKEKAPTTSGIYLSFWGSASEAQEGEEWKNGSSTKDAPENRAQRFAVYAPRVVDGKASLALYFVEEIER